MGCLPEVKSLGVKWRTEEDFLDSGMKLVDKASARCGLFSTLSSVYDPLDGWYQCIVASYLLNYRWLLWIMCQFQAWFVSFYLVHERLKTVKRTDRHENYLWIILGQQSSSFRLPKKRIQKFYPKKKLNNWMQSIWDNTNNHQWGYVFNTWESTRWWVYETRTK